MGSFIHNDETPVDVAIIGGGPAGLSAATTLKQAGIARVVVFEREPEAGGIPRHCGHYPFGMREFKWPLKGPAYAAKLVTRAIRAGVEFSLNTSVVEANRSGLLRVVTSAGPKSLSAKRVIYATGVRETPRSARLISGVRVQGVLNTGALQSVVYLEGRRPFKRPVIIGTELVAFSAIMTCRHAGMKPVAMIEQTDQVTARWPTALFPWLNNIPLLMETKLVEIRGDDCVNEIVVRNGKGDTRTIECDGVILAGQFVPESSLGRMGHIKIDPATGGPNVDQWGRCSDPTYFATGNLLRPVETAGRSWQEGKQTGLWVVADLVGKLPDYEQNAHSISVEPMLKYAMPQRIYCNNSDTQGVAGMTHLQLRVVKSLKGELIASIGAHVIWRKNISAKPERRIEVPIAELDISISSDKLSTIQFKLVPQI